MTAAPRPEEFAELAARATRGDGMAIETLVRRYLPKLHAYLRLRAGRLVLDQESCSDLAQSVCREVLADLGPAGPASEDEFRRWLFGTALRKIADRQAYYRAARRDVLRQQPLADEGAAQAELLGCYRRFCTPSEEAVGREALARIESAFTQLTDEQQEVIVLDKVLGLPRADVAARMQRSDGAVRVLLHRGLSRLAALLEER